MRVRWSLLLCLVFLMAVPPARAQEAGNFNCDGVRMEFGFTEPGPSDTNVSGSGECFSTAVGGAVETFTFSGPGRIGRIGPGSSCYFVWEGTLTARSRTSTRSFSTGMWARMDRGAELKLDSGQVGQAPLVRYSMDTPHWFWPADECQPDEYSELSGMSFDNGTITGPGHGTYSERNEGIRPTTPPTIQGMPQEGEVLRVDEGKWTVPMAGFSFQWYRCTATSCSGPIATTRRYTAGAADVGARLYVTVRAMTHAGYNTANTTETAPIRPLSAPKSTSPPRLDGNPVQGQRLLTSDGGWLSPTPLTFAYAWLRCDVNGNACVTIPGAARNVYTMVQDDVGRRIRSHVTATNSNGSQTARSEASQVVQPALPT